MWYRYQSVFPKMHLDESGNRLKHYGCKTEWLNGIRFLSTNIAHLNVKINAVTGKTAGT